MVITRVLDFTCGTGYCTVKAGGIAMKSNQKVAKLFGLLLILSIVFGIFSSVPVLETQGYLEELVNIKGQVLLATLSQLAMAITYVAITALLYPIIKKYSSTLAISYFGFRIIASGLLFLGIVPLLALLNISESYNVADQLLIKNYEIIGELVRVSRDWLNHIAVIYTWAFGGVILYYTFYQTKIIPKWMSIWAMTGAFLTITVTTLLLFDKVQIVSPTYFIMNTPTALIELILAGYLLSKGFKLEKI